MANGFLWAADHGADVANLRYGLSTDSSTINNAAQYLRSKGGLAVVVAGNNNTDRCRRDTAVSLHRQQPEMLQCGYLYPHLQLEYPQIKRQSFDQGGRQGCGRA